MLFLQIILFALAAAIIVSAASDYNGYKIYDINASTSLQKDQLLSLRDQPEYDFFIIPRSIDVLTRVMVEPKEQLQFESMLKANKMRFFVINENVSESFELNQKKPIEFIRSRIPKSKISFTAFHRLDKINQYLDQLAETYPNRVRLQNMNKSYEGRWIKAITISNGDMRTNKKAILIDAGIHAREWLAHSVALYIIQQLVENFEENADLLLDYDWVVMPVVNPDGYEYTHTQKRMWRKTRRPITDECSGADANRNFDVHWGEIGASSYSCADTFKGQTPFSEPEAQAVRDVMHSLSGRAQMYLTLHSFGCYLLYPWGWTSNLPNTWRDLHNVAQAGANAIRAATGRIYTIGSSANALYPAAGGSDDYALAVVGIPIAMTMELPGGGSGFDPLPSEILDLVLETWVGIRAMAQVVESKY